MYLSELVVENFRPFGEGENKFSLIFNRGLTALVGENDSGKTAVIDALRLALGTRDQEYFRIEDSDFHWCSITKKRANEIRISCKFDDLSLVDKSAFVEYLTYEERGNSIEAVLYINWVAKKNHRNSKGYVSIELKSGKNGEGPSLGADIRILLNGTYLRPLRDAERAMSSGRRSRLSQILQCTKEIQQIGKDYDVEMGSDFDIDDLSVLGVGDYANALLESRRGILLAKDRLNTEYLTPLSFSGDKLESNIVVNSQRDKEYRLQQLLEKLELELTNEKEVGEISNRGLGSNNILFMACELLLLGTEEGFPLLLIEEPEAHLHPQRQLRFIQFLQEKSDKLQKNNQFLQTIVTSHSPNLASKIKLNNLVLMTNKAAFSLAQGKTKLNQSDYNFLERFLDVTKANLFFARGVIIVEGDGENILLPTIATLIDCDLTKYGVSIVNVGGTGLNRFSRIFQRENEETEGIIDIPVACITDFDVMPDCAPKIIGKIEENEDIPQKKSRKWRIISDFDNEKLKLKRSNIQMKTAGQNVKTFVSEQWTFEYDLAWAGLAKYIWMAISLAKADEKISSGRETKDMIKQKSEESFKSLYLNDKDILSSQIYAQIVRNSLSKAIIAQYMAELLEDDFKAGILTAQHLEDRLPKYLIDAIKYVTVRKR